MTTSSEKSPLVGKPPPSKLMETFYEAYSLKPHATFEKGAIADYDPWKLSSLRVLFASGGTVLEDSMLFLEQVILTLIFLLGFLPTYALQSKQMGMVDQEDRHEAHDKLLDQEANIRKFTLIMTSLSAFLLSLYTSIMISRWWMIRCGGIGAMKAATSELQMHLSQFVTNDEFLLGSIRRYARASLQMIFMWRRGTITKENELRKELVGPNWSKMAIDEVGLILSSDEVNRLLSETWNHNLYESIWTWNVCIIETLHREGLINNEPLLVYLLDKCSDARKGVQLIVTHVAVKVPMQYVHLLGFIVKLHNIICAYLMGVLFSSALKERNTITCLQLYGRTLLLPFLFNAILLINCALADPFSGGAADFPKEKYDKGFEGDGKSFLEAGNNLPEWIDRRGHRV